MNILVTGATGYIGKRLIPILLSNGHNVIAIVRDKLRVNDYYLKESKISIVEANFLKEETLKNIPLNIDIAYYLIHSMSNSFNDFETLEYICAINFKSFLENTKAKQVIYLGGITNDNNLSRHLKSRKNVELALKSKEYALTIFKAGIIVGSGSSSFEIIRDLVEKLPLMIAPKWLNTKTQPIAVRDVLAFLSNSLGNTKTFDKTFDIYGPKIITYKKMLLQFAEVRQLKRKIITLPVMTPKLSSYWLYFVTSTSYKLALNLVDSMGVEIIGKPSHINSMLNIEPINYKEAVKLAFEKIEQNGIVSSWKDSFISSGEIKNNIHEYINVPKYGCFQNHKEHKIINTDNTLNKIWSIGGENGWYYGNFLWKIRGYIDKLFGGIGLRRGRTNPISLERGDALDFWRVIYADKIKKKLLLYAEMKLPGEAWLEFKIEGDTLKQTATFRPLGLAGRLYWLSLSPFHFFIFNGMIKKLSN